MRIYISGAIKNDPDYQKKFDAVHKELDAEGHLVLNPTLLPKGLRDSEYMVIDLYLISIADEVYMLKGWEESSGAVIERLFAVRCGKTVKYEWSNAENDV